MKGERDVQEPCCFMHYDFSKNAFDIAALIIFCKINEDHHRCMNDHRAFKFSIYQDLDFLAQSPKFTSSKVFVCFRGFKQTNNCIISEFYSFL